MTAAAILKAARNADISFSLNGDKLALKWAAKPPESLIEAIRADKANIVAILKKSMEPLRRQEAGTIGAMREPQESAQRQDAAAPPMTQPPLGVSRTLQNALLLAERHHVRFWVDGDGLLITQPPQAPPIEVHAAMRRGLKGS